MGIKGSSSALAPDCRLPASPQRARNLCQQAVGGGLGICDGRGHLSSAGSGRPRAIRGGHDRRRRRRAVRQFRSACLQYLLCGERPNVAAGARRQHVSGRLGGVFHYRPGGNGVCLVARAGACPPLAIGAGAGVDPSRPRLPAQSGIAARCERGAGLQHDRVCRQTVDAGVDVRCRAHSRRQRRIIPRHLFGVLIAQFPLDSAASSAGFTRAPGAISSRLPAEHWHWHQGLSDRVLRFSGAEN